MSKSENTGQKSQNQINSAHKEQPRPVVDNRKANDIEAALLSDLEYCVRYIRLAMDHADLFDHQGFVFSTEKFLTHARSVSGRLKELRKYRGVLD